ncbi:hypothetical protein HAX54_006950, partial [Datura stramonium]|nr:hypothetical protein [Datura stramonium]
MASSSKHHLDHTPPPRLQFSNLLLLLEEFSSKSQSSGLKEDPQLRTRICTN